MNIEVSKNLNGIGFKQQNLIQDDIQEVIKTLNSDFLTQGPVVNNFERNIIEKVGSEFGVAVNSATSGLHLACLALGLRQDDILWTTPNTYVSSANCGRMCGAKIDFVDIDGNTGNLSIDALKEKLLSAQKIGKLPKVLVSVHFAGQPTYQEAIWNLAQEYDFFVIEDASHSLGSKRKNIATGSCRYSHITVFSFHPVKIITTGEGGMVVTNDENIFENLKLLRNNGTTKEKNNFQFEDQGKWYYELKELGFNYRITDIQAALGCSQLKRLDSIVEKRNTIANKYDMEFNSLPIKCLSVLKNNYSSRHLYVIRVGENDRKKLFDKLYNNRINVNVHYIPVHLQPYYRRYGFEKGDFPEAELHGREALSLPIYPTLNEDDQGIIINIVKEYYGHYC